MYLQTIGVSPKFLGQGFGSRLLKAVTEYDDKEEIPIFLETTEENVKFFEKFGFQVLKEVGLSTVDLKMWEMVRKTS